MNDAVFIICEFNPFHFGHKYLTDTLRGEFGAAVCLMSGAFVQRGEPAFAGKYLRAKAAVLGGADLVLELPFPYSCLPAADFARAGVRLAASLGARALGFGAEATLEELRAAAEILTPEAIRAEIKSESTLSYPKAAAKLLVRAGLDSGLAARPNDILALEYIRAAAEYAPGMRLCAVKRQSAFAPSSAVRAASADVMRQLVPETTCETLAGKTADAGPFWNAVIARWRLSRPECELCGADAGTVDRVRNAALTENDIGSLCEKAASPLLTKARVRRTLIYGYFGVTPERAHSSPSYALLLASGESGRRYLAENRRSFAVPVITKPADHRSAGDKVVKDFEYALGAERVYALTCGGIEPLKETPFSRI